MKKYIVITGLTLMTMLALGGIIYAACGEGASGQGAAGESAGAAAGQGVTGDFTNSGVTIEQGGASHGLSTGGTAGQGVSGESVSGTVSGTQRTGAESAFGASSAGVGTPSTGKSRHGLDQEADVSRNQGRLNINTASVSQLRMVPGINRSLAESIVQYRESNGPFSSLTELTNISGVDPVKLNEVRYYLKVTGMNDLNPDSITIQPQQGRSPFPQYAPPKVK